MTVDKSGLFGNSFISCHRFDFGVPLEDVFVHRDVHPRLKFLLWKAYSSYQECGQEVSSILRCRPKEGFLNECLALKDQLVFAINYQTNNFSPEAYFWVIRHFLGLLPLPLLSEYLYGIRFDWDLLADESHLHFKSHDYNEREILEYNIAQALNKIPMENYVLLKMLVQFIRKLSVKKLGGRHKFDRATLTGLASYFCQAVFVRPFRPGFTQKTKYNSLFIFLILRWQNISKHCSMTSTIVQEAYHSNIFTCCRKNLFTNEFWNKQLLSTCPSLKTFYNKYLKETACQTDSDLCSYQYETDKITYSAAPKDLDCATVKEAYKLAYIQEETEEQMDIESNNNNKSETLYETAQEFHFNSVLEQESCQSWKSIMQETINTIQKVEESYIYDDYETFKKEEFNQIGKQGPSSSSLFPKLNFSFKKHFKKSSTPKSSPESENTENSYIKYSDVCTSSSDSEDSIENSDCKSNIADFELNKSSDSVEIKVLDYQLKESDVENDFQDDLGPRLDDSQEEMGEENIITKKKRLINGLRISLQFLRTLSPRKRAYKLFESKVRYCRMKNNEKSFTV